MQILFRWFFILNLYFLVNIPFSWAFDWNDKVWKDMGCPNSFHGLWILRDSPEHPDHNYKVAANTISFRSSESVPLNLEYQIVARKGFYYLLKINSEKIPGSTFNFPFLKVRPYQTYQTENDEEPQNCFIKVFQYDTRENADSGKYEDWDIILLKPL